MRTLTFLVFLSVPLLLAGCSSESDSPGDVPDPNTAPVAVAGVDQTVDVGDPVALDGSASSDADQDPLTYAWALVDKPAGSTAELTSPTAEETGFTADQEGEYEVRLVVNDGEIDSAADAVVVTAETPVLGWSAVERIVGTDDVVDAVEALAHPVPVRFDAQTLHLYFSGVAFKTYAVVPAYVYRMVSTDNGSTWSAPERLAQLEGNYQSYAVGHLGDKLLLIWHDGFHTQIVQTALPAAATNPAAPTTYLSHTAATREVIQLTLWDQTMVGMWHPTDTADYSPFLGKAGADTAVLNGLTSPYGGTFYHATLIEEGRAIVLLTDNTLLTASLVGSSLTTLAPLSFPTADAAQGYAGDTFHHAQFERTSRDLYFTGFNEDASDSSVYRVRLSG